VASVYGEIKDRLQRAAELVNDADVHAEFRTAAFVLAYRDIQSSASTTNDLPAVRSSEIVARPGSTIDSQEANQTIDLIAARLHVPVTLIERVVDVDEDGVHLIVQRRWLDTGKRPAMRQIALLSVATRQAAGVEEWTPLNVVRETCQAFGAYLGNHFSEDLKAISALRLRGSGAAREAKATVATLEEAGELITRLVPTAEDQ
jgi:hypothetical protein